MVPVVGGEGTADANTYLLVTALMGAVTWGTVAVAYRVTPITDAGVGEVRLVGVAGAVTVLWFAVFVTRALMARTGVEADVRFSAPGVVWTGTMGLAFVANFAGFFLGPPLREALMWLPWYAGFAVAYLATGLLVRRGGVFYAAGAVSAVVTLVGVGAIPVEGVGLRRPVPYAFVLLGVLHTVPLALDAALGGRELTEDGVPALAADETAGVEVVGGGDG